jgi:ABC-type branched-subunit amino acid transport system ATPase component
MTAHLLDVDGVDCSYGPLQVLFETSLHVDAGERVALLGTNGAGKSTLLRVISGLIAPTAGTVHFNGRDITSLAPDRRVSLGLVQIAGGRAMFPSLSVLDNIRLGGYAHRRTDARGVDQGVEEALDLFPALRSRLTNTAGTLSGGEQQMTALARALVARPRLLIIDELSLGLAPIVMQEILQMIDALSSRGLPMLIVEQSMNVALAIAERAYYMERGSIRFSGLTSELVERDDLVRSVFFGEAAQA